MDTLDIVIVAAAAVGIIAFISLAVVIVLQGRALKRLEERIGPPVPMGAAPSLERVRAIASQPEVRVDIPADALQAPAPGQAPSAGKASAPPEVSGEALAASAAAERAAERRGQKKQASSAKPPSRGGGPSQPDRSGDGGGNGALIALIGILVVAILAVGGWFFFLRGGDSAPAPATTGTTASSAATTGTTGTSGGTSTVPDTASEVPEEVPPVANKAAYTVAVLNASGVSGAAANRVAPRVQAAGYTLGVVDNATQQNLPTSQVQYVAGRKEVAWNVAKDLGITMAGPVNALSEGRIGTADVAVIVGKDLSK